MSESSNACATIRRGIAIENGAMVRQNGNFLIPSDFESNDAIEWINAVNSAYWVPQPCEFRENEYFPGKLESSAARINEVRAYTT